MSPSIRRCGVVVPRCDRRRSVRPKAQRRSVGAAPTAGRTDLERRVRSRATLLKGPDGQRRHPGRSDRGGPAGAVALSLAAFELAGCSSPQAKQASGGSPTGKGGTFTTPRRPRPRPARRAWDPAHVEGPYDPAAAIGIDTLLAALDRHPVPPNDNVWVDLGTLWRRLLTQPDEAPARWASCSAGWAPSACCGAPTPSGTAAPNHRSWPCAPSRSRPSSRTAPTTRR